jgi:hypothetical protein
MPSSSMHWSDASKRVLNVSEPQVESGKQYSTKNSIDAPMRCVSSLVWRQPVVKLLNFCVLDTDLWI